MSFKYTIPLFILIVGCSQKQETKLLPEENITKVVVVTAQERMYSPTMVFSGTVFANREANLGASLPGKVEKIFFNEGQFVKEGSLIVELSDEMLTQAQIEYETLKKDHERISRLREKGSTSEMEYDHIRAKYEASKAKAEMVRKNTRIYAPFSGVIVERMMEEGEVFFLNPGLDPGYSMRSGVVRLMQLDPVKVKFDVNEKELLHIRTGLKVTLLPDALGGIELSGKINSIKPILSTISRSTTAEVVIANPNNTLKPGMFTRVNVYLPEQKQIFVPISSISRMAGTGNDYVYTVQNSKVSRLQVERKYTINDMVAVKGIAAGAVVISDGKTRVSEGQVVDIVNRNVE